MDNATIMSFVWAVASLAMVGHTQYLFEPGSTSRLISYSIDAIVSMLLFLLLVGRYHG